MYSLIFPRMSQSSTDQSVNVLSQGVGTSLRSVEGNDVAVLVDEELGEVPGDVPATEVRVLSQVFVGWVGVAAVDVNLVHYLELDVVFLLEFFDFLVGARLLRAELVAWVRNDAESLPFVLLGQLNEALVVRVGQASLGRNVYDKRRIFARKLSHLANFLAIDGLAWLVEEVAARRLLLWLPQIRVGCEVLDSVDQALQRTKEDNIRKFEWLLGWHGRSSTSECLIHVTFIDVDANCS